MAPKPFELARRMDSNAAPISGITREIFTLSVEAARVKASEIIKQAPQGGQLTIVERWRQLPDGRIELTTRQMRVSSPR
jgi:hypothetical protein